MALSITDTISQGMKAEVYYKAIQVLITRAFSLPQTQKGFQMHTKCNGSAHL